MRKLSEEAQANKAERLKQLTEIAPEDKAYIVVQGRPRVFYVNGPGGQALLDAEEKAAEMCAQSHEDYTVMCVPRASVDVAIVAKYHGVVMHALDNLQADDEY